MGLGLRIASAKGAWLAVAGLLLFASPAYAACVVTDLSVTDTSTGDSAVVGDQAYNVIAPSTGLYFEDDIGSIGDSVTITNGVAIDSTGTFGPGIEIYGEFATVCYDGLALGSIVSDDAGILVELTSDGFVGVDVAHGIDAGFVGVEVAHQGDGLIDIDAGAIDAGDAGILVERNGEGTTDITANGAIAAVGPGIVVLNSPLSNGDVNVTTKGNITSDDSGVAVVHYGDTGSVSISTAAGTTISAYGGTGPGAFGPVGLYVERQGGSGPAADLVQIDNDADIDAEGVGIAVDVCDCANSALEIRSTGDINGEHVAGVLVSHSADGDVTIEQTGKVTSTDGVGIFVLKEGSGDVDVTATGGIAADILGISLMVDGPGNIEIKVGGTITTNGAGITAASTDLDSTLAIESSADIMSDTGIAAGAAKIDVDVTGGTIEAVAGIDLIGDDVSVTLGSDARIDVTSALGAGILIDGRSNVEIAGTIDAAGTDALFLSGGNATLTLLPGFEIDGLAEACACFDNRLILGGASGDDTFDLDRLGTQFVGFDTYLKTGASTWTLTGDTFVGLLSATGGTVVINDSISGLDLSLTGATLKGNAAIGSLTANAAIIAPGNSIGTVTVAGDVAIVGTSVYEVEVNASGASDKIEAGGIATLTSTASVGVTMEPGTYGAVTQYTILSAAGGVAGTLDPDVGLTSAFFDAALSYDPNNVYLTLTRNSLTLGDFAGTPNQEAAADALDAAGLGAPYFDELFVLPADEVPGALDAISGDGYASLTAAALDDGRFVRDAALDRRGARGIWTTPYGGAAHLPGDGNGPAVDHATGGLLLGADGEVGDGWLGVLLGYGQSRYDIAERDMSAASNEFSLGTYGGAHWDAFYASFGAAITGRDIGATRRAIFPGVSDTFTADYASVTAQAFTELGYRLEMGGTSVTPFGGLAALSATTSGYTESETGAGALTVAPSAATALVATLGLRLEHEIALEGDRTLALRASAAWRHAIGGASTDNSTAGTGTFTVAGAPLPADTLAVSAGTTLDLGQLSVGVDYTGSLGSGGFANAATATLAGTF